MPALLSCCLLGAAEAATSAKSGAISTVQDVPAETLLPGDAAPAALNAQLKARAGKAVDKLPNAMPAAPLFLAIDAVQTAIATCTDTASGVRVGAAVVDATGVVHIALSADGAVAGQAFVAARKALTAVEFKLATSEVAKQLVADPALQARVKPNMIIAAGGVPLIVNGQLLGALGVAGGTAEQDERCALAGAARIVDKLK